jgi:hypothetical protein
VKVCYDLFMQESEELMAESESARQHTAALSMRWKSLEDATQQKGVRLIFYDNVKTEMSAQ